MLLFILLLTIINGSGCAFLVPIRSLVGAFAGGLVAFAGDGIIHNKCAASPGHQMLHNNGIVNKICAPIPNNKISAGYATLKPLKEGITRTLFVKCICFVHCFVLNI